VIPSSLAITMGIELILFSFMLSTFDLNVRPFGVLREPREHLPAAEPGSDVTCTTS
jgi:hypothetical protein